MAPQMRTFTCPVCGATATARATATVAHPCPGKRTKTGRPQMVELCPE